MKNRGCILLVSMLFWASMGWAQNNNTKKHQLKYLPDIDVYDVHGKHSTLRQLGKNKVLFIDAWFIGCEPCFHELGMLHKLYAKYSTNKNFCFITICRNDSGSVKKFIAQDKSMAADVQMYQVFSKLPDFRLPVYFIPGCNAKVYTGKKLADYAPADKTKCPDAQFGFRGYPTIIIFNKKGKLILKKTGYDSDDLKHEDVKTLKMENLIKQALAAK
jgi:thiol-disulfide isomerase/thioredoxin